MHFLLSKERYPDKKNIISQSGQTLMEILVGVAIGALLIGTAATVIVPALSINKRVVQVQAGAALAKELLDNVRVLSEGNWLSLQNLPTGTSNLYYLKTSVSPFVITTGTESILLNPIASGTVGYWAMNEGVGSTTIDNSGNGKTATLAGAQWTSGIAGKGLVFTNTSTYAWVAETSSIEFGTSSFSFGCWFNTTTTVVGIVIGNENHNGGAGWGIITRGSGAVQGFVSDGGHLASSSATAAVNNGNWHYGVVVIDRSANLMHVYIDGSEAVAATSIASIGSVTDATAQLEFGADYNAGSQSQYLNGSVDEARIYNWPLTAANVAQSYTAQALTRYFYLSDVYRSGGSIVSTGGAYDPSTKLVTVVYGASSTPTSTMSMYLTRHATNVYDQTDWSGGSGIAGPVTAPGNKFSTSTNIDYTTTTGSLYISIPGY